jgi:hypothetical protein
MDTLQWPHYREQKDQDRSPSHRAIEFRFSGRLVTYLITHPSFNFNSFEITIHSKTIFLNLEALKFQEKKTCHLSKPMFE